MRACNKIVAMTTKITAKQDNNCSMIANLRADRIQFFKPDLIWKKIGKPAHIF